MTVSRVGARTMPPRLAAGARVRLVAPAGRFPADLLAAGVARLESWGLRVSVGAHAADAHPRLPYLAGEDAHRAADLEEAWCDPDVDAVLCLRGGYGCLRLIDLLDWDRMAAVPPKVFAGSSDITALHEAFAARLGVVTVFSPMIATRAFTTDLTAWAGLRSWLLAPDSTLTVTGDRAEPLLPGRTGGVARGISTGGNLSLLVAMLGGPYFRCPPGGAIVLLEDVSEDPYRVDRLVTQLLRANWFDGVAGIALGSWTDCGDPEELRAMLTDRLAGLGVPVAYGLRFGHCAGQATMPLGVPCELDADAGELTFR